jgi:hypothetical protein
MKMREDFHVSLITMRNVVLHNTIRNQKCAALGIKHCPRAGRVQTQIGAISRLM